MFDPRDAGEGWVQVRVVAALDVATPQGTRPSWWVLTERLAPPDTRQELFVDRSTGLIWRVTTRGPDVGEAVWLTFVPGSDRKPPKPRRPTPRPQPDLEEWELE